MSQTDPRAVATEAAKDLLSDLIEFIEADGGYYSDHQGALNVTMKALADERRRALEEAATICEAEALIDDERGYYGKEMAKAIRAKAIE